MSIVSRILGSPGKDNALWVEIQSGQTIERLLFDCGEGCLSEVTYRQAQAIDHLFFSHLHMDHVGGFDSFFRCNFARVAKPNHVWGPPQTARILQHRFQGFMWNLHEQLEATWRVHDVSEAEIRTTRFELQEAFAVAHPEEVRPFQRALFEGESFRIEAVEMNHRTPSLAYIVREHPRRNLDMERLAALGLKPGPWLKGFKEGVGAGGEIVIDERAWDADRLRRELLVESPGSSIAYLTDFLFDDPGVERLIPAIAGCDTIVCEAQYRQADVELARFNHHMTAASAGALAKRAGAGELILFHLSERYVPEEWAAMLEEARAEFPNTRFPEEWSACLEKAAH